VGSPCQLRFLALCNGYMDVWVGMHAMLRRGVGLGDWTCVGGGFDASAAFLPTHRTKNLRVCGRRRERMHMDCDHRSTPTLPTPLNTQLPDGAGVVYSGGRGYDDQLPPAARYSDWMFGVAERLGAAVSVKYRCPAEELDPHALITVADDDDLDELKTEYHTAAAAAAAAAGVGGAACGAVAAGGPPAANSAVEAAAAEPFVIECFAFPAAEEPLTPDEILGAAAADLGPLTPAGGCASRAGHGPGSSGSGGSSGGLYDSLLEQQALLHAMLPLKKAGCGFSTSSDEGEGMQHGMGTVVMGSDDDYDDHLIGFDGGEQYEAAATSGDDEAAGFYEATDEAEAEVAAYWAAAAAERLQRMASATQMLPVDPFEQDLTLLQSVAPGTGEDDDVAAAADAGPLAMQERGSAVGSRAAAAAPTANLPSHILAFGEDADDAGQRGAGASCSWRCSPEAEAATPGSRQAPLGSQSAERVAATAAGAAAADTHRADGQLERQESDESLCSIKAVHRVVRGDVRVVARLWAGDSGEVSLAQAPLFGQVAVKWLKVRSGAWRGVRGKGGERGGVVLLAGGQWSGCTYAFVQLPPTSQLTTLIPPQRTERPPLKAHRRLLARGRAARRPPPPQRAALLRGGDGAALLLIIVIIISFGSINSFSSIASPATPLALRAPGAPPAHRLGPDALPRRVRARRGHHHRVRPGRQPGSLFARRRRAAAAAAALRAGAAGGEWAGLPPRAQAGALWAQAGQPAAGRPGAASAGCRAGRRG